MSNCPKITKSQVGLRIEESLKYMVEKKYLLPGDKSISIAFNRAIEDAVRDVILTPDDLEKIKGRIQARMIKRVQQRRVSK